MPQLVERDAVAKREDLSDVIYIVDRKKTPFFSAVAKGTEPTNTLVEWPVDSYPTPTTAGAIDEKDVQEYENLGTPGDVLQGRIQIWERKPKVSRLTQLVANQAGVGKRKAFAKSVAKGLVMIKRDIEVTMLSDNESVVGSGTTGGQIRGLGKWIQTTAQTDLPVSADYRPPTGSVITTAVADITDDVVTGLMQSMYDQTGDEDMEIMGWMGSRLKRGYSRLTMYDKTETGLTLARRFNEDATSGKVTMKVDVLDTDYGRVILRLAPFINASGDPTSDASKRLGYFTHMDMLKARFAENPNSRELPDMGGGPRALIQAIGTLEVGNPKGFGKHAASA